MRFKFKVYNEEDRAAAQFRFEQSPIYHALESGYFPAARAPNTLLAGYLVIGQGMSYTEAARALNLSKSTVAGAVFRMREWLENNDYQSPRTMRQLRRA